MPTLISIWPNTPGRIRIPQDQTVENLTPAELLVKFWQASHVPEADVSALQELDAVILQDEEEEAAAETKENREPIVQAVPAK